jgi:hypothetical protein
VIPLYPPPVFNLDHRHWRKPQRQALVGTIHLLDQHEVHATVHVHGGVKTARM